MLIRRVKPFGLGDGKMNIIERIDSYLTEIRGRIPKIKSPKKDIKCEKCGAIFRPALGHEKLCNSCTIKSRG